MDNTYSSPKLVFLHLLMFALLYLAMIATLMLLFQYIGVTFEDPLQYSPFPSYSQIRWASSVLLIAYPVFLVVAHFVNKELRQYKEAKDLRIRKWLVYLTQFLSAITIIIDLIALVYNFYGGDLTAQFGLKVLSVLVVAAAVFAYYRFELTRDVSQTKTATIFATSAGVVLLAILVAGFFIVGSPAKQRALRFDDQRVQDLEMIRSDIHIFYAQKKVLPKSLDELVNTTRGSIPPKDPETGSDYAYTIKDADTFELCANFNYASNSIPTHLKYSYPPESGFISWEHPAGPHCFEETIDPIVLKNYLP